MSGATLDAFLGSFAASGDVRRAEIAEIVRVVANAASALRGAIGQEALEPRRGGADDGEGGRQLAMHADESFLAAVRSAPAALYCSSELDTGIVIDPRRRLGVAIDPLDGVADIDANATLGTLFSVLPTAGEPDAEPLATFLQPGQAQLAAGLVIYGPQLALALTLGSGTHVFVFSRRLGTFVQTCDSAVIAHRTSDIAVNMSNFRHWHEPVHLYVDDCLKGTEGPRQREFELRWSGSPASEIHRILMRGGVLVHPADQRRGHSHGRLRLVHQANPIALLVTQAGGAATDTRDDMLDRVPANLHQRVPLVAGSAHEVARIGRYHTEPSSIAERSPLFGTRGLFRA